MECHKFHFPTTTVGQSACFLFFNFSRGSLGFSYPLGALLNAHTRTHTLANAHRDSVWLLASVRPAANTDVTEHVNMWGKKKRKVSRTDRCSKHTQECNLVDLVGSVSWVCWLKGYLLIILSYRNNSRLKCWQNQIAGVQLWLKPHLETYEPWQPQMAASGICEFFIRQKSWKASSPSLTSLFGVSDNQSLWAVLMENVTFTL